VIQEIIRNNASIFDNKNLNEFLDLVRSSKLVISDSIELSETHPVIQQFYKLISEGVTPNFTTKTSDQANSAEIGKDDCFDYEFSNHSEDYVEHFKCTSDGFPLDFPHVSVTSIEDNQILGTEILSDSDALEKFGRLSHITKKVMLYDRYIFRPVHKNRYHNIQNTVVPILVQIVADFKVLKEITIIGSDLYLPNQIEKCTSEELSAIAEKIYTELADFGFSGKVTCAVINRKTDHYEHGRWLFTDYLKFKSDDSWNFLKRSSANGIGPDISIYPNYKRRHLEQLNHLFEVFDNYLINPATLIGTNKN